MKRVITVLLTVLMVLSLASCASYTSGTVSDTSSTSLFDAEKELHTMIWEAVADHVLLYYDNELITTTLELTAIEVDGNMYTGKGKFEVTVVNIDDKYEGEVTGVYKLEGETFTEMSLDIETPRKIN